MVLYKGFSNQVLSLIHYSSLKRKVSKNGCSNFTDGSKMSQLCVKLLSWTKKDIQMERNCYFNNIYTRSIMKQEILLDFVPMLISMIYPKHFLVDLNGIHFNLIYCRELCVSRFRSLIVLLIGKNFIEHALLMSSSNSNRCTTACKQP